MATARFEPQPYEPPGGRVLLAPLLTGGQLARRIGRTGRWVTGQPYLLRIEGQISAGAAYPAFQLQH